jgi:hypothetical protein
MMKTPSQNIILEEVIAGDFVLVTEVGKRTFYFISSLLSEKRDISLLKMVPPALFD